MRIHAYIASLAASLVAASTAAAQVERIDSQSMLLVGRPAPGSELAGVKGELELRPIVTRQLRAGDRIIDHVHAVRGADPALFGVTVGAQVLTRTARGGWELGPFVAVDRPQHHVVDAQVVSERGTPEGDTSSEPQDAPLPDVNSLPPVPMPVLPPDDPSVPRGDAVWHDIATGKTEVAPPADAAMLAKAADFVPASSDPTDHRETDQHGPANYGAHSLVSAYTSYPWRANCKLAITFPSGGGGCSGTMIDPCHTLTAGHCIHTGGSKGKWATSVRVIPAYNGDRPSFGGREPYGEARATRLLSWTGWTVSRSGRHDVGVIRLNRAIGGITGWFGYGFNTRCSWFTTPTWHHASYPGEKFSGRRMYYQFGDFDSCPNGEEARYNRLAYKGESGSGHYKMVSSNNRVVYGVMSHRHGSGPTGPSDATRLTSGKFSGIGSFRNAGKPSSVDVHALWVKGSTTVARGTRMGSLSFLAYNYSRVSRRASRLNFEVRLSTNRTISTADRRLGSWFSNLGTLSSQGGVTIRWSSTNAPIIPSTTAVGTYYIGIRITTADASSGNNTTGSWDVHPIRVTLRRVNGRFRSYGSGCVGTAGKRPVQRGSGNPFHNTTFRWTLTNARPNTAVSVLVGLRSGSVSLTPFGAPGCTMWLDPSRVIASFNTTTSSTGNASIAIRASRGANLYSQYAVLDPGAPRTNVLRVVVSNGVQTVVGGLY